MRALPILCALLISFTASAREPPKKETLVPGTHVEEQLARKGLYLNSKGKEVHKPSEHVAPGAVPDGATAQCGDGTYSFSHSRSGTCSRHDGVGKWLR